MTSSFLMKLCIAASFCLLVSGQSYFCLQAADGSMLSVTNSTAGYAVKFDSVAPNDGSCPTDHMWTGPSTSGATGCFQHLATRQFLMVNEQEQPQIVANTSCANGFSGWEVLGGGCLQSIMRSASGSTMRLLKSATNGEVQVATCTAFSFISKTGTLPTALSSFVPTPFVPLVGRYCIGIGEGLLGLYNGRLINNIGTTTCTEELLWEFSDDTEQHKGALIKYLALDDSYLMLKADGAMQFTSNVTCTQGNTLSSIPWQSCRWLPVWSSPASPTNGGLLQNRYYGKYAVGIWQGTSANLKWSTPGARRDRGERMAPVALGESIPVDATPSSAAARTLAWFPLVLAISICILTRGL